MKIAKPYNQRGGGLRLSPAREIDVRYGLGAGPDVSWIPKCKVGDDQGADGACVIFALASWSEVMTGRRISNAECLSVYRDALKALKRPDGSGLYFPEGFKYAPREWFGGARRVVPANMLRITEQPLLGGYDVTAAFDRPNAAGCLNHRAGGMSRGGHALLIVARGGLQKFPGDWIWIENSWGLSWGYKGLGVMNVKLHTQLCREIWAIE